MTHPLIAYVATHRFRPPPVLDYQDRLNRLSRFTYTAGNTGTTKNSESVLITSIPKENTIHSGGWCGFKPSDYGSDVRVDAGQLCLL